MGIDFLDYQKACIVGGKISFYVNNCVFNNAEIVIIIQTNVLMAMRYKKCGARSLKRG